MRKRWSWSGGWWPRLLGSLDWKVIAAYGAVLGALAVVLVVPTGGTGPAVPALAQPGGLGPGGRGDAGSPPNSQSVSWFWAPKGTLELLRSSLVAGMPALGWVNEEVAPAGRAAPTPTGPGLWLKRILGVNPFDPRSLLAAEIPGMKDPGPAERGENGEGSKPAAPPQAEADVTNPAPVVTGKDPLVAIYHTHAYESYASEVGLRDGAPLSYASSNDNAKNIVAVGARMAQDLAAKGVPVVHSEAHHGPQVGAYVRSRRTAQEMLKEYPSVQVLLDLHRDSQPRALTTTTVGGKPAAKIMIVVAKGSPSLKQPYYPKNLEFAERVKAEVDRRYPGIMRPIYQEPARYNQDLLPGAILFEMGGPENTREEINRSVDLFSAVLADILRQGRFPRPPKAPAS
ncbi:MAG: stage II sporulation protein P [Firmicutes bacterium]|nr:stage II sporulation protein P [Bacillota bacterium]